MRHAAVTEKYQKIARPSMGGLQMFQTKFNIYRSSKPKVWASNVSNKAWMAHHMTIPHWMLRQAVQLKYVEMENPDS
jgi:hypothetical protein